MAGSRRSGSVREGMSCGSASTASRCHPPAEWGGRASGPPRAAETGTAAAWSRSRPPTRYVGRCGCRPGRLPRKHRLHAAAALGDDPWVRGCRVRPSGGTRRVCERTRHPSPRYSPGRYAYTRGSSLEDVHGRATRRALSCLSDEPAHRSRASFHSPVIVDRGMADRRAISQSLRPDATRSSTRSEILRRTQVRMLAG